MVGSFGQRTTFKPRAAVTIQTIRRAAVAFPFDAVLLQPVEQVEIVVGPHPDELAVAEPAHRLLRPRPVGEGEVGGVLDPLRLLQPVAAADIEAAIAHHGAAADVEVLLDDDDRGALLACRDGGDEPAGSRADHDDVGLAVPGDAVRRLGLCRQRSDGAHRGAAREEAAAIKCGVVAVRFLRGVGSGHLVLPARPGVRAAAAAAADRGCAESNAISPALDRGAGDARLSTSARVREREHAAAAG